MGRVKEDFIEQIEKLARGIGQDPEKLEEEFYRSGECFEDFFIRKTRKKPSA